MYFFTHLFMGKILYGQLSKNMFLDFDSFLYGNIKPDLPQKNRLHHTQENYYDFVLQEIINLKEKEFTIQEFSSKLGEICHYICDFFCYYHQNEILHQKKINHFFYEILLHISITPIRFRKNFYITNRNHFFEDSKDELEFSINKMLALYKEKPHSFQNDLDFSLTTASMICENILVDIPYTTQLPFFLEFPDLSFHIK